MDDIQAALCRRIGAEFKASPLHVKVGVALATIGQHSINALRHPAEGDTSGWYIWAGEKLDSDPEFFQPIHIEHLAEGLPRVIPFLGLAPG